MHETGNINDVAKAVNTNLELGLTTEEAKKRLEENGENVLKEKKKKNLFMLFISQLNDPMIFILLAAALITVGLMIYKIINQDSEWLEDLAETIIILVVVLLNGTIGTVQEAKAEKALEALKKLASPHVTVRRDGELKEIKVEELVVGDLLIVEEGRVVGADIRLTKAINLKADEASLTGESVPSEKSADLAFTTEVPIGDRKNMLFMSTPVSYGRGEGIVVATGMNTEIGKIATILSDEKDEMTPLQKRLAELSKFLGILTIALVALLFIIALFRINWNQPETIFEDVMNMFTVSISLAVAAVPEGLPAVVTIVLAIGVQRMAKVNAIVRKLPSVETLGAVSVVCSDKTGTLTQNKMTVVKCYVDGTVYDNHRFKAHDDITLLASGLALCSDASIEKGIYGDPTEIALVQFAMNLGKAKSALETEAPRIKEYPFDSVRKMMSTLHQVGNKKVQYTKGALDNILKLVTKINLHGEVIPITEDHLLAINQAGSKMSSDALRVLALAYKEQKDDTISETDLIFLGLIGMIDPPRPEAKPAVIEFKKAGITTVMITGDHKDTAFAIAKELGIATSLKQVLSGDELLNMTQEELNGVIDTIRVFARVSPETKVMIVRAFKNANNLVAMTGDGVNDAPSLKVADVGIAMGITGTDVAKGASDIILADDNFASIKNAVEEGRSIYANIKKTVLFLLSCNLGEVFSMLLAELMLLPLPLSAIHILWVNLVTDSLPAIALGSDDKEKDNMRHKPRKANES
ncbi:MAG: HAD-IC family P-type ATPase, partial [Erysipelotrichaceae bacterium]|nr:HAD-IC family P-type ATPase [Erysipelotrichaceae bacterium]